MTFCVPRWGMWNKKYDLRGLTTAECSPRAPKDRVGCLVRRWLFLSLPRKMEGRTTFVFLPVTDNFHSSSSLIKHGDVLAEAGRQFGRARQPLRVLPRPEIQESVFEQINTPYSEGCRLPWCPGTWQLVPQ